MAQVNIYRITPEGSLLFDTKAATLDELTPQLPGGYYTTFRTHDDGRRALGLSAHLMRLYQPLEKLKVVPEVSQSYLRQHMAEILKACQGESRIRLVMTKRGELYLAISPLRVLSPKHYLQGVKVVTSNLQRVSPRVKATSFISYSQSARKKISKSNNFEALLVKNDFILEGMTSNFFYVRNEILGTARNDVLLGVTRRIVLRVAQQNNYRIVYRPLKQERIPTLSEAFLTSSSRGIVPIIQIDDTPVGEGVPGQITKKLMSGYQEYVMRHAELIYGG